MAQESPEKFVHFFRSCNSFEEAFEVFKKNTPPNSASFMLEAMALHFEKTASKKLLKTVYRRIGDIYTQMSELEEATKWYKKVITLEKQIDE